MSRPNMSRRIRPAAVRAAVLLHASLLLAAHAAAQQPPGTPAPAPAPASPGQPVPRLPLVPRTPARSEWTVRISHDFDQSWLSAPETPEASAAVAGMRKVRSIRFSKDAQTQTYRLLTRWTDGTSEEEWIVAGLHVAERAGGRGLYVVGSEVATTRQLQVTDFPELAWLDMNYYRGVETFRGKPVFTFSVKFDAKPLAADEARFMEMARRRDPSATPTKVFKPKVSEVTVHLDAATQLPLLYNDGTTLRRYSFQQPPGSAPLRPPARIADFIRQRNAALKAQLTPPAGPGDTTGG